MKDNIIDVLNNASVTHTLKKEEITALLQSVKYDKQIFKTADNVRKKYVGDDVHLRALIEFSNYCKQQCLYCGLRNGNKNIFRYRMSFDEIISAAKTADNYGYKTVVLQSGEDDFFTAEKMSDIISNIKKLNVAVTLSVGEKTFEEYGIYKQSGADRFLVRIETTDRGLYEKMSPGMSWENRAQCFENIKKLGFEAGSGCLVGLPSQTAESLADDILFFKEKGADMIGIGPFIPNPHTPLKNEPGGTLELALKVMAVTRILIPDANIPATTAMETLQKGGQIKALQSGANVIMPNVTEMRYKKHYELYPGKTSLGIEPSQYRELLELKLKNIGRNISDTYGFRNQNIDK